DLTDDGTPDLIIPGNVSTASNTPPGLWLASGNTDGSVSPTAVNIGIDGLGYSSPGTTADWNGAQAITGNYCGLGTQDALAYIPGAASTSNPHGGGGAIVCGDTSGAPLHTLNPVSGTQYPIDANSFQDPGTGVNATQVAGGGSENDVDAGGVVDLYYGTVTTGTNTGQLEVFGMSAEQPGTIGGALDLANQNTPTGGTDWNHWTITAAQMASGTAMYLWNSTTGDLYLWTGIALNSTSFDQATGITYTTHPKIASGWHTGATNLQLRAADINNDGTPDLWVTDTTPGSAPNTTSYLLTNLTSTTATLTAQPAQNLITTTHAWLLGDATTGTASTAADSTGTLTLSGSSTGATWNTGDMFAPDVTFDGTNGYLTTSSAAVTPSASFTLDAWAKPTANSGGVILSQDGTSDSDFLLYPNGTQWEFGINNGNTSTWSFDGIAGGSYQLGVWNHLTVTYNAATKLMNLYDNGVLVAAGSHTPVTGQPAGSFRIGDDLGSGTHMSRFAGQVSAVHTWNQALTPVQVATLASLTPPVPFTAGTTLRNLDGGLCLDAVNNATTNPSTNGDNVQLWTCNGSVQQNWTFHPVAGNPGWYTITNGYAGLCLDASNSTSGPNPTTNGDNVQLWTCNGYTQQEWQYTAGNTLKNYYGGLLLDATNNSTTNPSQNGDNVQLWSAANGTNQIWY
ncbi:RICIN domain-containing protein, partial [Actinocrinis puniceicyclus]